MPYAGWDLRKVLGCKSQSMEVDMKIKVLTKEAMEAARLVGKARALAEKLKVRHSKGAEEKPKK